MLDRPRPRFALLFLLVTLLAPAILAPWSAPAGAQEEPPAASDPAASDEATDTASAETEPAPEPVPPELRTPRAAMTTFLEAFDPAKAPEDAHPLDRAAMALDLSGVDPSLKKGVGRNLASQLKEVLDKTELIDLESIPDAPDAEPWTLEVADDQEVVVAPNEAGRWQFTEGTLDRMPELLAAVTDRETVEGVTESGPTTLPQWLRSQMPKSLLGVVFLIETWQWLGLFLVVLLGVVADRLLVSSIHVTIQRALAKRMETIDPDELRSALRPVGLLAASIVWWLGILWLGLPPHILKALAVAVKFIAITAFAWSAYRVVDIVSAVLDLRAQRSENTFDDMLVPLFRKSSKIFIAAIGVVFIADNLGVNITSLLAGLSIGGLALALAAQDAVRNLFGSLLVILDQPFSVGDWVKIGDVEGTVTELGFRSTRVKTFYDSVITLPNANLIDASVDNLGAREYRRWSTHLGLTYDTPAEKVEAFCEGVRELIRRHPYTRKDVFHVYLNRFSAASIDVMLYVFFSTPDWATELRERHRLALDIMRLAQHVGVEFAFPTQTLYLHRPSEAPEPSDPAGYDTRLHEAHETARERARRLVDGALAGKTPPPVGQGPGSTEDDGG